ncbi:AI-2E family transporter [Paracoccus sp. p4-l81]|uniref:AI-2E family transporter n=1 Tax=Paracoccus sp. p4-l81 TaxID=3342806 RepID=UPI0035B91018
MADHDHFKMFPVSASTEKRLVPGWAIIGIFLMMLFYFIADAREFLMPLTLAMLLFFVFMPFRRFMERRGVGSGATAGIVTVGIVLTLAVLGYLISGPAGQLIKDAPQISQQIEQRLDDLRSSFRPLEAAAQRLDELSGGSAAPADGAAPAELDGTAGVRPDTPDLLAAPGTTTSTATGTLTVNPPPGQPATDAGITVEVTTTPNQGSTVMNVLSLGPSVAGQVLFTLILLFFLLASGDLLYLKIVQSFDTLRDKRAAYMALREIESSLGAYLGAITIINAGLGVAIGLAMWAWGMPSPLLFGLAGFLLNYIPYIGSIIGTIVSALVALVVFDGVWEAAMVGLTFLALTSIEGQFVTPYFVSRRLQLNTVVVFITVALWAWLWSVLGMIVAVPVLVVLRVLAEHIPGLEKFGNFLAGEAPPELEEEDEEEPEAAPSSTAQLADELLPGAREAGEAAGVSDGELEAAALAAATAASEAEAAVADAAEKSRKAADAAQTAADEAARHIEQGPRG